MLLSGALLVLQKMEGVRMIHIEREVFAVMIVALILTSGIATGFYREQIDIEEGWKRDDFPPKTEDAQRYRNFTRGLFYDGSMYTRDIVENGTTYELLLHKWDRDLTEIVGRVNIPLGFDPADYQTPWFENIKSSGSYIHCWLKVKQHEQNATDNPKIEWHYVLLTFEGKRINSTRFYSSGNWHSRPWNKLIPEGSNATIMFEELIKNTTQRWNGTHFISSDHIRYDTLNLSFLSFSNGILTGSAPHNVTLDLTDLDTWDWQHPSIGYFPGQGTISMMMSFMSKIDGEGSGDEYRGSWIKQYYTKFGSNGSMLIPPLLVSNGSSVRDEFIPLYGNFSSDWFYYGYGNMLLSLYREWDGSIRVDEEHIIRMELNASSGAYEPNRTRIGERADPLFRTLYNSAFTDENERTRFTIFRMNETSSNPSAHVINYEVDRNGKLTMKRDSELGSIPIFGKYEKNEDEYEGLVLFMYPRAFFSNENTSYQFIDVGAAESLSVWGQVILITHDDGFTYYEYGIGISEKETKTTFFATIIISSILGIGIPVSLWYLMKKRGGKSI